MPCYSVVQKRAVKLKLKVPPQSELSDQDIRDIAGALDHDDLHRIIYSMTNIQFADFLKRIWARRKKRADALYNYAAQKAHY
jgi:predicted MarR family transcription regulator